MALSKLAKSPAPPIAKGPECRVCRALEALPKAEADGLVALMSNPAWPFKAIAEGVRNDPDLADEIVDGEVIPHPLAWVRDIPGPSYGRHATAGCAAQVRLRPRK